VAVTTDPTGAGVDPEIADGIRKAADALAQAGYEVVEADPPGVGETSQLWLDLVAADLRTLIVPAIEPFTGVDARTFLDMVLASVPPSDLGGYMGGLAVRNTHARNWSQLFTQYDLVIGPVSTMLPFEVGFDIAGGENPIRVVSALGLTVTCNLLGLPAAVVPVGVSSGLPQAVQIIGPRYQEMACLDAAEDIESILGVITPIQPVP
jgi:amidase